MIGWPCLNTQIWFKHFDVTAHRPSGRSDLRNKLNLPAVWPLTMSLTLIQLSEKHGTIDRGTDEIRDVLFGRFGTGSQLELVLINSHLSLWRVRVLSRVRPVFIYIYRLQKYDLWAQLQSFKYFSRPLLPHSSVDWPVNRIVVVMVLYS